jgi:type IV secretory pathway TraG/TraD family ATPase VirD4
MRTDLSELVAEVRNVDRDDSSRPLGTARWMGLREALTYAFPLDRLSSRVWIGEAFDNSSTPLAYADDRHVCLVSGTRGGKGAGIIVPNLCRWPGSCFVIDPKGENATITARRRGAGSAYCRGLGQKVYILDPFNEVPLDPSLKARFNPLDIIDPEGDLAVVDAGQIAASILVPQSPNDAFWEDSARGLLKALILYVLADPFFEGRRNLVTVRRLVSEGLYEAYELAKKAGKEDVPSPFKLLWVGMSECTAFNRVVAGTGVKFLDMPEKQRASILQFVATNTEFIESAPMQRMLEASDFDLSAIKTDPKGVTIYLTLPRRYMADHFRWLRLMTALAVGEMERIKGPPRTGNRTLFLLDEFAGLKRMEVIEHSAAQAAGFAVKFFYVVQNLPQLKEVYKDAWETFVSNSGLKLFFQIDDEFTRKYLSGLLGEQEVRRETQSGSTSNTDTISKTVGSSWSSNVGSSTSTNRGGSDGGSETYGGFLGLIPVLNLLSRTFTRQSGRNWSVGASSTEGKSKGTSKSHATSQARATSAGWGEAVHKRPLLNPDEIGRLLSRIDDRKAVGYPGVVLALVPGKDPLLTRRVNYFSSPYFAGLFDPHPDHPPPPTLAERQSAPAAALPPGSRTGLLKWIGVALAVACASLAFYFRETSVRAPSVGSEIAPEPAATADTEKNGAKLGDNRLEAANQARPKPPVPPPAPVRYTSMDAVTARLAMDAYDQRFKIAGTPGIIESIKKCYDQTLHDPMLQTDGQKRENAYQYCYSLDWTAMIDDMSRKRGTPFFSRAEFDKRAFTALLAGGNDVASIEDKTLSWAQILLDLERQQVQWH